MEVFRGHQCSLVILEVPDPENSEVGCGDFDSAGDGVPVAVGGGDVVASAKFVEYVF